MNINFTPTTFDKAFCRAVEFLLKEGVVESQRSLADAFGLAPSALSQILSSLRGVPREKKEYVVFVLTNEFNVNREFLMRNKGPILAEPIEVDTSEHPQYEEVSKSLQDCMKENELLKVQLTAREDQLNAREELIEMQRQMIKQLQDMK